MIRKSRINRLYESNKRRIREANIGTDGWDIDEDGWDGKDPNFGKLSSKKNSSIDFSPRAENVVDPLRKIPSIVRSEGEGLFRYQHMHCGYVVDTSKIKVPGKLLAKIEEYDPGLDAGELLEDKAILIYRCDARTNKFTFADYIVGTDYSLEDALIQIFDLDDDYFEKRK